MADINFTEIITAEISVVNAIIGEISTLQDINGNITIPSSIGGETYQGDYTITPSQETQVLNTQHKTMSRNVTINPIPSNYGLITWNGSTLTVS